MTARLVQEFKLPYERNRVVPFTPPLLVSIRSVGFSESLSFTKVFYLEPCTVLITLPFVYVYIFAA